MNERIKALAAESKLMAFVEDLEIINAHDVSRVEKFAELIVKECIGFVENINDREDAVAMLKVHFGVEEVDRNYNGRNGWGYQPLPLTRVPLSPPRKP